ncbi:siderophore-interacting protein [Celeribacter neptunius]|uniref:NADPH-dependent ferric siderophore reductase, contains FAD-binding and SIP domains n=1 Tax=Celeribacter neptunius TaxID=588602 RepID=A0A1I3X282_9RHOB|nr:siderophore-interacting protein [Celeribacter neptunius]SFK13297.1 NADPH-dependent ferric siderophore reductase, contains FAD-binding and SIP domains [Celeribacter neptunius]
MEAPTIRRMRHELKFRELTVARTERLTPHMIRLTLTGEDLADFASGSFDDHMKVFVPGTDDPAKRDYTPRRFDTEARELIVDFADHGDGPAASWARGATAGSTVQIGGPRGSRVIEGEIGHWVLIGDETALPAMGRKLEELPAGVKVTMIAAVPGPEDEQQIDSAADVTTRWLHRPLDQATDARFFLDALPQIDLTPDTFVWIATEAGIAKQLRAAVLEMGHPLPWLKAAGYWIDGEAEASIKDLDAPAGHGHGRGAKSGHGTRPAAT